MPSPTDSMIMQHNVVHGITSVLIIIMLVVSLILSLRIKDCAPVETTNEANERKTIQGFSGLALGLVLFKCVASHVKKMAPLQPYIQSGYRLLVFIVAILNISYLSKLKTEPCAASSKINMFDIAENKHLVLCVLILSIVVVVFQLKEFVGVASMKLTGVKTAEDSSGAAQVQTA
jgi:hypothetical protein